MPSNKKPVHSVDIPEISSIRAIKYLTCQGGGMKGVGDVGAVKALEEAGVLAQIEEVAGSSAGGIVATLIAIGCTADEIKKEMLALNFGSFQDKDTGLVEASRIKDLAKGAAFVTGSVVEKINLLKKIPILGKALGLATKPLDGTISTVATVLGATARGAGIAATVEDIAGAALGFDLGIWKGETLKNAIAAIIAKKTGKPNITFRELEALTKIPGGHFKGLTLTGSNLTLGKLEYYNARLTPDMPIVDAMRISASVPGAFKPVIMDGQVKVDGGLLENLPDVFNKKPYVTPERLTKKGGNPEVFALSFVEPGERDFKKIKTGIDIVKACFSTKLSEEHLQKKYGQNIAYINTTGVDTLQFDATEADKEALIESGAKAVREALTAIVQKEKQVKIVEYNTLPIEELVRREYALSQLPQDKRSPKIQEQLGKIRRAILDRDIPDEALETLRKKENERIAKKLALINPKSLPDKALANICAQKQKELVAADNLLRQKLKNLRLARNALQLNREALLAKFKSHRYHNEFYNDLQALKRIEDGLNEVTNKKNYSALKFEQSKKIETILQKYKEKKDELLVGFFEDILQDSKNLNFTVPCTTSKIWNYCAHDINACIDFVDKTKAELAKSKAERETFLQYGAGFAERTDKSTRYSALLNLKAALDTSINRKTTLLTQLNDFFAKKAPKLQKVVKPFLKLVGFGAYMTGLVVGSPFIVAAKVIKYFSTDPKTKASVDSFTELFQWTDLDLSQKLQGFRNTTAEFLKKLNDNYLTADKVEHSYLYRLHANFLKNSGIPLQEIFNQDPKESTAQYNLRLEKIKKLFSVEPAQQRVLKDTISSRSVNQKVSKFKIEVLKEVLKKSEPKVDLNQKKRQAEMSAGARAQVAFIRQQNTNLIHLEYLTMMDEMLKADPDKKLTHKELKHYLDSSKALGRELSLTFKKQHHEDLQDFLKSKKPASPKVDVKVEAERTKQALSEFMKERKAKHTGTEKGKLESHSISRKHKPKRK